MYTDLSGMLRDVSRSPAPGTGPTGPDRARHRREPARRRDQNRRDTVGAPRLDGPVELEVDVFRPRQAERALFVPGVHLGASGRTLCYTAASFPEAYQLTQLIVVLGGI
jgi:D-amino peptidase